MEENQKTFTLEDIFNQKHITELAEKLGLPKTFFSELGKQDDWTFIIKLHALIEAAVTQLLSYHFAEPKLEDVFSNLEMSNVKTGKIAFLKGADLLGDHYIQFIIKLSELRNKYVHNVSYATKTLKDIIASYDAKQLESFALRFSPQDATILSMAKKPAKIKLVDANDIDVKKLIERANKNPKLHIWIGAYIFLGTLADMYGKSDYIQYEKAMKNLNSDSLDNEEQS